MNVIGVQTQSVKGTAWMTFTVEVADSGRLAKVLGIVAEVPGVRSADEARCRYCAYFGQPCQGSCFALLQLHLRTVLRRVAQLVRAPP